jgi:putative flippase GtrA
VIALLRQFVKFTGVGFVSAIGHYGLLIALVQIAAVPAVPASAAGALLGAWINYSLNYRYTFRSARRQRESVPRFAAVAAIGVVLNTLFMWVGVELIGAHYLLSQVVTTGLVLIWSFAGNRYWTFHSAAGIE